MWGELKTDMVEFWKSTDLCLLQINFGFYFYRLHSSGKSWLFLHSTTLKENPFQKSKLAPCDSTEIAGTMTW